MGGGWFHGGHDVRDPLRVKRGLDVRAPPSRATHPWPPATPLQEGTQRRQRKSLSGKRGARRAASWGKPSRIAQPACALANETAATRGVAAGGDKEIGMLSSRGPWRRTPAGG